MDLNQSKKVGLLRCKPEKELLNAEMLKNKHKNKELTVEKTAKELRIVLQKIEFGDLPGISGIKRSNKEIPENVYRPKRSTRNASKRLKYSDFVTQSDESNDNDSNNLMDSQIDDIFSDSCEERRQSRSKRSALEVFSDCSDFDETYSPSKDDTLRLPKNFQRNIFLTTRSSSARSKRKAKDVQPNFVLKFECEETRLNIPDNYFDDVKFVDYYKPERGEGEEENCNDTEASSDASNGEGEEFDLAEMKKTTKKIWHRNYGYIISCTMPNGIIYLRCHRLKCKGKAHYKNGRLYTGNQKHNHSRKLEKEVRECDEFRVELYNKIVHEKMSDTREIYEIVRVKYPNAAKTLPFPQMHYSMSRWKRKFQIKSTEVTQRKSEQNSSEDEAENCNDTKRSGKKRKLVLKPDTASSSSSGGEGEEVDFTEMKKTSKKIWHRNYGYVISRTLPNGSLYLICHRHNCKGTAHWKNGRLYSGVQKHNHSRKLEKEVRECDEFRMELFNKLVHEKICGSTREIYDMVGAKYPTAAKTLPFPQMHNLMYRWKKRFRLKSSEVTQRAETEKNSSENEAINCKDTKKSGRSRKKRKLVFQPDTASSASSGGEGEEVDFAEMKKISKKIWHRNYGYIISRTLPNGSIYLRCHRHKCKGTAHWRNGRLYSGVQKHNHSRKQDIEIRECDEYRTELYKVVHEKISASTREIYDMVGAKYPIAAKKLPFPQMNNLMRRWKRNFESNDNIKSLNELTEFFQRSDSEKNPSGMFFSGKVVASNNHVAIVLGFKQLILEAYSQSKLLYIDTNLRVKSGVSYIDQILTMFCISQGKILPMCYVLMENNTLELYEAVFQHVKDILANCVNPSFIICDYEQNLRSALAKIYHKSHLHGHFFHFAQRIYYEATKLKLISISEGELANYNDNEGREHITDNDKIIMQYYSLALLPEEAVQDGLQHLMEIQPDCYVELSNYLKNQWINDVGIQHFSVYQQTSRANDIFDVYCRKINGLLKNCTGSIKIYDALEKYHEFIRKQCLTLQQGERANQSLSRQDRFFHPNLKQAWDNFQTHALTVPMFMDSCSEFLGEMHYIFKYWHTDDVIVSDLYNISKIPFIPQEESILTNFVQVLKKEKESSVVVRPYAKISPNREIRYRNANVYRHDGYAYNRQNIKKKSGVVVIYMACRVSTCNGTLIVRNDVATPGKNGHNHLREETHNSEKVLQFKKELRCLVKEHRNIAANELYKIAAETNPEAAQVYSLRLAMQAMSRWKRELRSSVTAAIPDTMESLNAFLLSEEGRQIFCIDSQDINYYSGMVKTTTGQSAVIFGDTQFITDNFKASQNWIIDSNYRAASKSPAIHHMLVVLSLSKEHVLPIAYILLEDRSEDLYAAVFSHIKKNLAPGIIPSYIMCDYDEMIHNAIKDIYNETILQGSLFHYAQAIYRKAYSLNIINDAETNPLVLRMLMQYYALALLPSDLIESGLEYLSLTQTLLEGFPALYNYVKTQWLERVGPAHLSTFMQCFRTSNVLELFQRVFNDKLSDAHPPIFELLELILKIHNISKSDSDLLRKGKRQYLDRIGQRFDRLIDFKVNALWKKLSSGAVCVADFLTVAIDYLQNVHFVYNTWDLHDDKLDIKPPLMIEDNFILQTDDMVRAAVLFIEIDDTQNSIFDTKAEAFEQPDSVNLMDFSNEKFALDSADKVVVLKKSKPKGRIMTKRGNVIWQDGYCYYGNKFSRKTKNAPERRYMQCRVKGCRGTAIIVNGEFQVGKMEHNHKQDFHKEQTEEFQKSIKDMVFTQPLSNREIYDLAATMDPATAALVPFQSLESRLRRWRTSRYIPIMPTKLSDMDRILTDAQGVNLVQTRNGSLYSGTVTLDNGRCAVILAEDHFIKQLMSSTNMYVERNCRCAPRDVYVHSVLSVMFLLGFQVIPVAYILLEDDSEDLYLAAFNYFKETLVPSFNPAYIMCDYDEKLHNVLGRIYCESNIQGCCFHYAQAIYRKAADLGLAEASEYDEASKVLKQYYALPLLPAESMANGLQYLNQIQPKGFIELWNYVKTEWLDQIGSEHLSVYKQPYRCNDTQEQFHKRHNGILEEAHPGIIHLIVHLKKTHDITLTEYGSRLKQRPLHTVRRAKQLFHSNLSLLWKRHINPNTPVDNFLIACEDIMNDFHYVFNTWDKEEHITNIIVPYLRNCAFVRNPDSVINSFRGFKKNEKANQNSNDVTDYEQSEDEYDDQNAPNIKKEKIPVTRYSEILWRDGYGFHIVKKSKENAAGHLVTYIRCKVKSCRVRGSIANGRWNLTTELHSHSKDIYAEQDAAFRLTLKQMVRDQPLPIDEIYNLVASLYPDSAVRTPLKKIRPMMLRWKKNCIVLVSTNVVGSLIDAHRLLIGDSGIQLVQTANGSIYSGNVTTSVGESALVFAENNFIQAAFLASTNIFIDTHYRCTPKDPFVDHILVFFGVCKDYVLPFAYVLMGSNSEELYLAVLNYVKNSVAPNINPEYIMCDFDINLHNSVRQVYNSAHIHGCFYHYAQSIYRKALSTNIIDCIQTDTKHNSILMQYYSIPLLPKDDIEEAFHHLSRTQPPEFKKLWMYVRKQWMDRVGPEQLSMFGQPYRANATFEVFSRKLNDLCKEAHPNMYDLIGNILKLHQFVRADFDQLRRGRHAQRVGRGMDRLFHADVGRVWRRLSDSRISVADFMHMTAEYMVNTHFVFSTWDVSNEKQQSGGDDEPMLPYMLDVPFVAHWCVNNASRPQGRTKSRRKARKADSVEEKDCHITGEDNCDDFDNNCDDSSNEATNPMPNYEPVQVEAKIESIPEPVSTPIESNRKLCFLCNAQNRTHACIPCGHLSYCVNCFPVVSRRVEMDKKCPVCLAQYMLVLEILF